MRISHRLSKGLFYFPLKINILEKDKIKILRADNGNEGFACLMFLFIHIYKNEYFRKFSIREKKLFCDDEKIDRVKLDEVLETCFKEDIFSEELYNKYEILTSKTIQSIWSTVTIRRDEIVMIKEYMLIKQENMKVPDRLTIIDLKDKVILESVKKLKKEEERERLKAENKPAVVKPKKGEKKIGIQNVELSEEEEEFLPGDNHLSLAEDIRKMCKIPWLEQPHHLRRMVTEETFTAFKDLNLLIDKTYTKLRYSNNQLTLPEFNELITKPIDNLIPNNKEILAALEKLVSTGVNKNASIYFKLKSYISYVREDKNKAKNGANGNHQSQGKAGHKIDHSKAARNF